MKSDFSLRLVDKPAIRGLLEQHHYLSGISRGFKTGFNVGLFHQDKESGLFGERHVGVCIFTGISVPHLLTGMFGLDRHSSQEGMWELGRLCVHPSLQGDGGEHNITSWFLARSIRMLRKTESVRAILSYADSDHHQGTIYRACNFKYYGLTDKRPDFWAKQSDGSYILKNRGPVKHLDGEWRPRTQKHRFLMVFDKTLSVKWTEEEWTNRTTPNQLKGI